VLAGSSLGWPRWRISPKLNPPNRSSVEVPRSAFQTTIATLRQSNIIYLYTRRSPTSAPPCRLAREYTNHRHLVDIPQTGPNDLRVSFRARVRSISLHVTRYQPDFTFATTQYSQSIAFSGDTISEIHIHRCELSGIRPWTYSRALATGRHVQEQSSSAKETSLRQTSANILPSAHRRAFIHTTWQSPVEV
jgi:hypothetical protein